LRLSAGQRHKRRAYAPGHQEDTERAQQGASGAPECRLSPPAVPLGGRAHRQFSSGEDLSRSW
jgi:hypothetical protein